MEEQQNEREFYTLVDEDGVESEFELIGACEYQGKQYFAMIPASPEQKEEDEFCEYVILRQDKDENGEDTLITIDDDEEFDNVADIFDDQFSEEIDYDEK